MQPIGIYIHVPFCAGKCPYCDFYSVMGTEALMDRYTGAVLRTATQYHDMLERGADTLYFGGGTPSLLGAERLVRLIDGFRPFLHPQAEITVECNPSGDLEELLPRLTGAGVNRISLGMQSAVESERKALGRRANRKRLRQAIALCRAAGITNLSLDLMLGIPGMTLNSLKESLDFLLEAEVPHISAYLLKIEPGTPFAEQEAQLHLPEEDAVCDQYLYTVETLEQAGLRQYEISNFAKPGYESRHNLKYWRCDEYLGLGPAAHSFLNGQRFYYPRDLQRFLDLQPPHSDGVGGSRAERLMLALRLAEGAPLKLLGTNARKKIPLLVRHGLLLQMGEKVRLTPKGFLLSNSILCELLEDEA